MGLPIDLFRFWWWLVLKLFAGLWRMLHWAFCRLEPLVDAALVFALELLLKLVFGLPLIVILAVEAAASVPHGIWQAFRWFVLAPGLWKSNKLLDTLVVVRAIAVAVVGFAIGLQFPVLGAVICLGAIGSFPIVILIQLMAQDAIHAD